MTRPIHLLLFLMMISSCSEIQNNSENGIRLINAFNPDTLTIEAQFADCGEWGGHIERIDIYQTNNSVVALFTKDTVKCPDPANTNRNMIHESTLNLSEEDQIDVVNFLQELMKRSFQDEVVNHAGNYYQASRSNGELFIRFNNYHMDWTGFERLKMDLTKANPKKR